MSEAWEFAHTVETRLTPRAAWEFWTDVTHWTLDAAIEWVRLDRPFAAGARGTTQSRGGEPVEWLVKEADPPARALIEIPLPGAVMSFEWRFEAGPRKGALVTQRARLSGPEAAAFRAVADAQVAANMPAGMLKLIEAMERSLGPRVRAAQAGDAARVAEIYNQGIEERTATFETALRTAEDMELRVAENPTRYPVLVAEQDGAVVGWASLGPYRPRACYAGVSEFSVYVDRLHRGSGVGGRLLEALIASAAACGHWKLVSRVFTSNSGSRALCRSLGFREVGTYEKHARLDGQWLDVVIVERLIPENQA